MIAKDLTEWAESGRTGEAFRTLLEAAPVWTLDSQEATESPWRCSLDLLDEPLLEEAWLIDGLIPSEGIVLVSAREGSMKTWLVLEWAKVVADGTTFLGRTCEAAAVLWLDAEMPKPQFQRYLQEVGASRNLNIWRWQDQGFPTQLSDPGLLRAAKGHGLIVIDSLTRFMDGLDENSPTQMTKVTGGLRELTRWGATVIAIHHVPKDSTKKEYRGATELGAGVDLVLMVTKAMKDHGTILRLTASLKTRYAVEPNIVLNVERTPTRPVFNDVTGNANVHTEKVTAEALVKLQEVIKGHLGATGTKPNQSTVIKEAGTKGLGARNTILKRLTEGEGEYWQSVLDG